MQSAYGAVAYDPAGDRVLLAGTMSTVQAGCPVPSAATWFWDISGGVFDPAAALFGDTTAGTTQNTADSVAVRSDGVVFFEVGTNSPGIRPVRAFVPGTGVVDVPGAVTMSHLVVDDDGIIFGLDTSANTVRVLEPGL
jgi:hypothetical protein